MATPTNLPAAQTTGNVLTSAYVNDLRGAFRILQVIAAPVSVTQQTTTLATYKDVGLSATITPQATSSKILIVYSVQGYCDAATTGLALRIFRDATSIRTTQDLSYGTSGGVSAYHTFIEFDSPNSTSAITYKIQFARNTGAGLVYVNTVATQSTGTMYLLEVSA
jgi:hypothetical protein